MTTMNELDYLKEILQNYQGNMISIKEFEKEFKISVGRKLTTEEKNYLKEIYKGSGM